MFKLTIETDNAAFDEDPEQEVIRILKDAIGCLAGGFKEHALHDVNGNTVGQYRLTKKVKK